MRLRQLAAASLAVGLMAAGTVAWAGVLTFQGVTFAASSSSPNLLTIEIDAAGRTGDWASAVSMDVIGIKNVGMLSGVSLIGPGGAWNYAPDELNANGCGGGTSGGACFSHVPVALTDNMLFDFTFTGGAPSLDAPTLKVRFLDASGDKVGSLLSATIPEPATYGLLLVGLGPLVFAIRRKRRDAAAAAA